MEDMNSKSKTPQATRNTAAAGEARGPRQSPGCLPRMKGAERSKQLENRQRADQHVHPALALLAARPDVFARQGSVVASWRRRGTRAYGPYYRLIYREASRQRSIYLGRAGGLVEEIRGRLRALQAPLRGRRVNKRAGRQAAALMRASKAQLNLQLRPWGLRLQGFEVRGWRTSPIWAVVRKQIGGFTQFGRFAGRLPRLPGLPLPRLPLVPTLRVGTHWVDALRPRGVATRTMATRPVEKGRGSGHRARSHAERGNERSPCPTLRLEPWAARTCGPPARQR
jgi:hypothetical protein